MRTRSRDGSTCARMLSLFGNDSVLLCNYERKSPEASFLSLLLLIGYTYRQCRCFAVDNHASLDAKNDFVSTKTSGQFAKALIAVPLKSNCGYKRRLLVLRKAMKIQAEASGRTCKIQSQYYARTRTLNRVMKYISFCECCM